VSNNLKRMRAAIAEARAKKGEKPVPKPCCKSGWADIHTRNCPKNGRKK